MADLPSEDHPLNPSPSLGAAEATGLYLHVPFCSVKCRFCDFAAYPGRRRDIPRYLDALEKDIARFRAGHAGRPLGSVYFGGGTPSLLSAPQLVRVLDAVRSVFSLSADVEITLEANPESVTRDGARALRAAGVNRLSLGLQSAAPALLKVLGREHTVETFDSAFAAARAEGFDNVNVDLMFGLPGQSPSDWRSSLRFVLDRAPEHVSAYALTVEDGTYFRKSGVVIDDDRQADFYETAAEILAGAGYRHYEVSNFARSGRESRHNLRYWRNRECLGAGASAAWYSEGVRRKNHDDLDDYLRAIESGRDPSAESTVLSAEERRGEDLLLGLRLSEGVSDDDASVGPYRPVLERFRGLGFLTRESGRYRPTRLGWQLSNQMFVQLLAPPTEKN